MTSAKAKRADERTQEGLPFHSFQTLLRDLATCTLNRKTIALAEPVATNLVARPTPLQAKAFERLSVDPNRSR